MSRTNSSDKISGYHLIISNPPNPLSVNLFVCTFAKCPVKSILVPKGASGAAEGCCPLQELESRRAEFLVVYSLIDLF